MTVIMPQKYTFQLKYPNNSAKKCATRQKRKRSLQVSASSLSYQWSIVNGQWSIVNGQSSPPILTSESLFTIPESPPP